MNAPKPRKNRHERAIRINISLPPTIVMTAQKVILEGGYEGLSDYVAAKIRRDGKLDPEDRMAA